MAKKLLAALLVISMLAGTFGLSVTVGATGSELSIGDENSFYLEEGLSDGMLLSFKATSNGVFTFKSIGNEDLKAHLYDSSMNELAYDDDGGENYNFLISYSLEKGNTYYLEVSHYSAHACYAQISVKESEVISVEFGDVYVHDFYDVYENYDAIAEKYFDCYDNYYPKIIKVTLKNGEVVEAPMGDILDRFGGNVTIDELGGQSFATPWHSGRNTATATYLGLSASYNVYVTDNVIDSISVQCPELIEGLDATTLYDYDYESGEYIEYSAYDVTPPQVTVTMRDGRVFSGDYWDVFDIEKSNGIPYPAQLYHDQSPTNVWGVGEHEVTLFCAGFEAKYNVYIVENPVESVYFSDCVLYEGVDGDDSWGYDENTDQYVDWFCYYYNPTVTINYKDGTQFVGTMSEAQEYTGKDAYLESFQSPAYPWGPGNHVVQGTFMGHNVSFTATVVESNVDSIVVSDVELIKNVNGSWQNDYNWDTDQCEDWFRYDFDPIITIYYTDGTFFSGTVTEVEEHTGRPVYFYSYQSVDNRWGVGTYTVDATILNCDVQFNATIVESNIESVTVDKLTVEENTSGLIFYIEINGEEVPYYYYSARPETLHVKFKNGTTFDGTIDEFEEIVGCCEVSTDQSYYNQWGPGKHVAALNVYGELYMFDVEITPTRFKKVEVESTTIVENTNGYYMDVGGDSYFFYNAPPKSVTVYYKDGTSFSGDWYSVKEYTGIDMDFQTDQSYKNQWGLGDHTATLYFGALAIPYTVSIVTTPIKSITTNNITIELGTHCFFDGDYNPETDRWDLEYIRYSVEPEDYTVTLKDNTVFTATAEELYKQFGYIPSVIDDQAYGNEWGLGTHTASVAFLGTSSTFNITIVPSTVKSVSIAKIPVIYGETSTRFEYNEEIGEGEWYDVYSYYPSDVTVTYKNGTVVRGTLSEIADKTGISIYYTDDQSKTNVWGLGVHKVNARIPCLPDFTFDVEVIPSPAKSVSVTPVVIYKGVDMTYMMPEYFSYRVTLQNGTVLNSEDGAIIYLGQRYYPDYYAYADTSVIGTYYSDFSILGVSTTFSVTVVDVNYTDLHIDFDNNVLVIQLTKSNGVVDTFRASSFSSYGVGAGDFTISYVEGALVTDKHTFNGVEIMFKPEHTFDFDNISSYKNIKIKIGGLESNVLNRESVCTVHVYEGKIIQTATFTQPEITQFVCKNCGHTYTKETAPILTHNKLGDLNGDGKVNAIDSNMLGMIIIGNLEVTDQLRESADINGDGKINAIDGSMIMKLITG